MSQHRTGADHGPFADDQPRGDGRIGSNGGAPLHGGPENFREMHLAAGVSIVRKCGVGTDEDIVFEMYAVPKLDPAFYGDTVAYDDIVLDKGVVADVAIRPDAGAGQYVSESPDSGSLPDVFRFHNCGFVLEITHFAGRPLQIRADYPGTFSGPVVPGRRKIASTIGKAVSK
jgi:hypothetical protein